MSILEALREARTVMLHGEGFLCVVMAQQKLRNAIGLLERGYGVNTQIEPLIERYGTVDMVPGLDMEETHKDYER